jgi:glycosyltransferase involved in cell wall biosynthesis
MTFSVVCPVYNEIEFITQFFDFIESVKNKPIELFVIDGMSTDGTRDYLDNKCKKLSYLRILDNPNKTVPFALNLAIPLCTGEIIIRIDAHTKYAIDYFDKILDTFDMVDADIVGGPTRTISKNSKQEAIAYMFNTSFGMGNSSVHDVNFKGYTDSVTFGAWKRDIFNQTGLFDTQLKRNQDDEFHYRAKSKGYKIYQNPEIQLFYYPRSSFNGLFKQYFEYGLYKPLVLKKIKTELKLRHLVPSLFVSYLFVLGSFYWLIGNILLVPLFIYFLLNLYFVLKAKKSYCVKFCILLSYPTVHLGYGLGFNCGLFKKVR